MSIQKQAEAVYSYKAPLRFGMMFRDLFEFVRRRGHSTQTSSWHRDFIPQFLLSANLTETINLSLIESSHLPRLRTGAFLRCRITGWRFGLAFLVLGSEQVLHLLGDADRFITAVCRQW